MHNPIVMHLDPILGFFGWRRTLGGYVNFGKPPRQLRGVAWGINHLHHNLSTGVDTAVQCLGRPIENALGFVKIGGKIGEGIIGFWPPTNSILVFRPQTTVQNFIKFDS